MATPLAVGGQIIYTSPLTPAQLRSTLAAIKLQLSQISAAAGIVKDQILATTISAGNLVYPSAADTINLADADAAASAKVVGFATTSGTAAQLGNYQHSGLLTLTDWTAATGSATLTSGSFYYLSSTAGRMTTTAPSASGSYIVPVGIALSTTDFLINILRQIKV